MWPVVERKHHLQYEVLDQVRVIRFYFYLWHLTAGVLEKIISSSLSPSLTYKIGVKASASWELFVSNIIKHFHILSAAWFGHYIVCSNCYYASNLF